MISPQMYEPGRTSGWRKSRYCATQRQVSRASHCRRANREKATHMMLLPFEQFANLVHPDPLVEPKVGLVVTLPRLLGRSDLVERLGQEGPLAV